MSDNRDIDALRAMDHPVTPPREADERIRALIGASIQERVGLSDGPRGVALADDEVRAREAMHESPDITASAPDVESWSRSRTWSMSVVMQAAAGVLLIAGLALVLVTRSAEDPADVAAGADPLELTAAEIICTGSYAQLGDLWREILAATTPGYAVDLPIDRVEALVERQYAFLDSVDGQLEAGRLPELSNPDTLAAARSAVDESQAWLELRGSTDPIASVGISHRALTQLIEENPSLRVHCDPMLIAWPQ